jgi:hypothetical protein
MSALLSTPIADTPTLRETLAAHELPAASAQEQRLAHIFRGTLKLGRIHPLYLQVLKYRQAGPSRNDRG